MRLKITLNAKGIHLPYAYARGIQGFLYACLSPSYAKIMHNEDPELVKPFTFSNLLGKHDADSTGITFSGNAAFWVASTEVRFLNDVYQKIQHMGKISLVGNIIDVISAEPVDNPEHDGIVTYRTISPITVYDTGENGYHTYYSPEDNCFADKIEENLGHKYMQLTGNMLDEYFNLYMPQHVKKRVCRYKGFAYTAYDCTLRIDTSAEIHNLIMDAGLGARNAAGFGMVEILRR